MGEVTMSDGFSKLQSFGGQQRRAMDNKWCRYKGVLARYE